ncbi:MAG: hypothetical protein J2P57_14230 [Acidimicrobiaceae bacterium]|nr:hypothetical protein [Acidimicrobiaceae bacterium]
MKREDLVLEVTELTELLRTSPTMAPLREALARQGVDSGKALLGSFYEDEDSHEYGVVIRDDGMVFEYTRDTGDSDPSQFTTWKGIEDLETAVDEYPQIEVALGMVRP